MSIFKAGQIWLFEDFEKRRKQYDENKLLFKGDHYEVFAERQFSLEHLGDIKTDEDIKDIKAMTYVVTNYCGLLSKLAADMLFGENPTFITIGDISKADESIGELVINNNFYTLLYESALGNSHRGDSAIKVRWAKVPGLEERKALIEPQNPRYMFPIVDPGNKRYVKQWVLCWIVKSPEYEEKLLRVEVHERGMIYNYLYKIRNHIVQSEVSFSKYFPGLEIEEVQETGIDDFLVYHIPNMRDDEDFWGYSDYIDIKSLQDACNNRFSQIDSILDKHADPKMKGPAGALDADGKIDVNADYFPYSKESVEPGYITWEAKLESAFKEIDYILKMMFLVTETSPAAFGLENGGVSESGRALKYRLMRTLSKTARKKRYYDPAIKWALLTAQKVENEWGKGNYEPAEIEVEWRDGLPDDSLENAEEINLLESAGAISIEEKVRRANPDWSDEKIEEEVNKIRADRTQRDRNFTI